MEDKYPFFSNTSIFPKLFETKIFSTLPSAVKAKLMEPYVNAYEEACKLRREKVQRQRMERERLKKIRCDEEERKKKLVEKKRDVVKLTESQLLKQLELQLYAEN